MDSSIKIKNTGSKIGLANQFIKAAKHQGKPLVPDTTRNHGMYFTDGLRRVDYVIVYKEEKNHTSKTHSEKLLKRQFYEENLHHEGLELEHESFVHNKSVLTFIKIHVPFPTLCHKAEELSMKTEIWIRDTPEDQLKTCEEPTFWQRIRGHLGISGKSATKEKVELNKRGIIRLPFSRHHMERYAIKDPETYFKQKERIEIAFEIMQKVPCNPKEPKQRGIECLLDDKVYKTAYPLHDGDVHFEQKQNAKSLRAKLMKNWARWRCLCSPQPFHDIQNYFGEKIAFYFSFLSFYTWWLIFPSTVGVITFLYSVISLEFNSETDNFCIQQNISATIEKEGLDSLKHIDLNDLESQFDETFLLEESFVVSHYWMCPVCRPPHCNAWKMIQDGCFYYKWSFRLDNYLSFILSSCITLWAILFLKFWRRREATLAAEWDTQDVEEQKVVLRPEYIKRAPMQKRNPITLEMEPFIPTSLRIRWLSLSGLATALFLTFACVCLFALVVFRIILYGLVKNLGGTLATNNVDVARWIVHGLVFVVALVLEVAYVKAAYRLTRLECPKTEKEFLNSLLIKIFVFAILNDLIPIGYAAWVKGRTASTPNDLGPLDELCDGGCMGEVTELVSVLLLLRLVVGNALEIGIPLLQKAHKHKKINNVHNDDDGSSVPQFAKDYLLKPTEFDGVHEDYMEMMIQFAFITLFIPSLPVAPFVCLLNNIAEIRVDAMKMLSAHRRPLTIRTSGIGIWNKFLDVLNKMGIVINAGLLAFTSDNVPRIYYRFFYNPGHGDEGYTKFILSKMSVDAFDGDSAQEMKEQNITECWYQDYRHPYEPYDEKLLYWEMMVMRLAVFGFYCVIFYTIMWLINSFVSDIPESVKIKKRRHKFVTSKTWESDRDKEMEEMKVAAFDKEDKL